MKLDPGVWGSVFPELVGSDDTLTKPILGFRVNRVQLVRRLWGKPSVVLRSMGPSNYSWEPGRNEAVCLTSGGSGANRHRHLAPATACSCGLYACHDLRPLQFSNLPRDFVVLAGVAGTGIVRIHARGWRAQYARIVAFSLELPGRPIVPHVRALLGQTSLREDQILRVLGYDERTIRARKGDNRLSPGVAQALEAKYQVPVVPLQRLKAVMAVSGNFWEEET